MSKVAARASEELSRLQGRIGRSLMLSGLVLVLGLALGLPLVGLLVQKVTVARLDGAAFQIECAGLKTHLVQAIPVGLDRYRLYFVLLDGKNAPVRSLRRESIGLSAEPVGPVDDFDLTAAAKDPLTLLVAVDTSNEMTLDNRMGAVQDGVREWLQGLEVSRLGLISFGNQARVEREVDINRPRFLRALDRVIAGGERAMYDAVASSAGQAWGLNSRSALVLITSGEDRSSKVRLTEAASRARNSSLPVFVVGVGPKVPRASLEKLAVETRGRAFFAPTFVDLPSTLTAVSEWLTAEFRIQVPAVLPWARAPIWIAGSMGICALFLIVLYLSVTRWLKLPRLVVLGGPKHGTSVHLASDIIVCGSDPGCHLQVPGDPKTTAGRRFAMERRGGVVSFHLLDPSGGTAVNRAVVESRDLMTGDIIKAGLARFVFFRYESQGNWGGLGGAPGTSASQRVQKVCWLVSSDGGPAFAVERDRTRVGREPDNEIVLEDPSVSRRHAEFIRTEEGLFIADLGSRNGTYLEKSRVGSQAPLFENTRLRFGRVKFRIKLEPPGEELSDAEEIGVAAIASIESADGNIDDTAPDMMQERRAGQDDPAGQASQEPVDPVDRPDLPDVGGEQKPGGADTLSCPVCSHINRTTAKYCTQCGEKLTPAVGPDSKGERDDLAGE